MFRFIIPTIVIITCFQQAHATYWTQLQFSKGDILQCTINAFSTHILLATSNSDVAHMMGDTDTSNGRLREESWDSYHRREGDKQTDCRVRDYPVSADLAVDKAREDISRYQGQKLYYHLLTCNCEHWVTKWTKGKAFSYQSLLLPSSKCDVNMNPITDGDFARYGAKAKSWPQMLLGLHPSKKWNLLWSLGRNKRKTKTSFFYKA